MNRFLMTVVLGLGLSVAPQAFGQNEPSKTQPDNTRANKGDATSAVPTADNAKNSRTDRETMQQIRKAIVADKSLSTYAHNVKVISEHGKVTLRGPVHSEEERKTIEAKAEEVAGAGNVTSQITVKGDASSAR